MQFLMHPTKLLLLKIEVGNNFLVLYKIFLQKKHVYELIKCFVYWICASSSTLIQFECVCKYQVKIF